VNLERMALGIYEICDLLLFLWTNSNLEIVKLPDAYS
jgi:hypothetical protein